MFCYLDVRNESEILRSTGRHRYVFQIIMSAIPRQLLFYSLLVRSEVQNFMKHREASIRLSNYFMPTFLVELFYSLVVRSNGRNIMKARKSSIQFSNYYVNFSGAAVLLCSCQERRTTFYEAPEDIDTSFTVIRQLLYQDPIH